MVISQSAIPDSAPATPACHHHWIIDNSRGQTAAGTCRLCGTTRTFENSSPHLKQQAWVPRDDWKWIFPPNKKELTMESIIDSFTRHL